MSIKQIILYSVVLVAAVALTALAVMSLAGGNPTAVPTATALPTTVLQSGPVATATPDGTTSSTPSATEVPNSSSGLVPQENQQPLDLAAFQTRAIDTVTAYATFTNTEPAADRFARITAAAGAGTPIASGITGLALTRHEDSPNWSARTGIVGRPYAGVAADNGTSFTFTVVTDYWGSYGTPEAQSQQARGTWTVTIASTTNADGTVNLGVVTSITEPDFNLS